MEITIVAGTLPEVKAQAYFVPQYPNSTCLYGANSALARCQYRQYIQSYDLLRGDKTLPVGTALSYETGLAGVRYLIHSVILPNKEQRQKCTDTKVKSDVSFRDKYRADIQLAVYAAVQEAQRVGAESLAIPLISSQYDAYITGQAMYGALMYCLDLPIRVTLVVPSEKIIAFRAGTRRWKNFNPVFIGQNYDRLQDKLRTMKVI